MERLKRVSKAICTVLFAVVAALAAAGVATPAAAWATNYTPTSWDDEDVFSTGSHKGFTSDITYVDLQDNDVLDLSGITEEDAGDIWVFVQGETATIIGSPDILFTNLNLDWQTNTGLTNTMLNVENLRYQGSNPWTFGTLTVNYSGLCEFAGQISNGANLGFVMSSLTSATFRGASGASLKLCPGTWNTGEDGGTITLDGGSVTTTRGIQVQQGKLEIKNCDIIVETPDSGWTGIWVMRNWNQDADSVGILIENSNVSMEQNPSRQGVTGIMCDYTYNDWKGNSSIEIVGSQVDAWSSVSQHAPLQGYVAIGNAERIVIDDSIINARVVSSEGTSGIAYDSAAIGNQFKSLVIRNGSTVVAEGYAGAGVGTGALTQDAHINPNFTDAWEVSISDSNVTASSRYGAGIGAGCRASNISVSVPSVDITVIGNSDVTAYSHNGAAIGSGALGTVSEPVGIGVPLGVSVPSGWDQASDESGAAEMQANGSLASALAVDVASSSVSTRAAGMAGFPADAGSLTIEANNKGDEPTIVCESGQVAVSVPVTASKPMMEYTLDKAPDMTIPVNRALVDGVDTGTGAPSHDLRQGFKSLAFWSVAEGTYRLTYGSGQYPRTLVDAENEAIDAFEVSLDATAPDALNSFNVKPVDNPNAPTDGRPSEDEFTYVYTTERIVYPAERVELYSDQQCAQLITLNDNIITDYIGKTIYARYENVTETGEEHVTPVVVPDFSETPTLASTNVSATVNSISYASSVEGVEYALLLKGSNEPLQVISGTGGEIIFTGLSQDTTYTLKAHRTAQDGEQGHFRSKNATLEVSTESIASLEEIRLDSYQQEYVYTGDGIAFSFSLPAGDDAQEGVSADSFTVAYYRGGQPLAEGELPREQGTYTVLLERPGDATYATYSRMFGMYVLSQATVKLPADGADVVYDGSPVAWSDLGVTGAYGAVRAEQSDFSYKVYQLDSKGERIDEGTDTLPTSAGAYEIDITLNGKTLTSGQRYISSNVATLRLTIAQAAMSVTATSHASDAAGAQTETEFTYGETIYVRATIAATGTAAGSSANDAITLHNADTTSLTAPAAGQAALYLRITNDSGETTDTQLTAPQNVTGLSDELMFSYNTTEKGIPTGDATLVVKYTGTTDMAPAESSPIDVTLGPKQLTASIAYSGEGVPTKVYDGTVSAPSGLSISLSGIEQSDGAADKVSANATSYTYNSADVAGAQTITAHNVGLTGDDQGFYAIGNAEDPTIAGSISSKPVELAWSADELAYTGEPLAPTAHVSNLVTGDSCSVTVSVDGAHTTVGTYLATATALSNGNYTLDGVYATHEYRIVQSTSAFSNLNTWNGDEQSGQFTYGDTITVKGAVTPTGTAVSAANDLRATAAPTANQVALYHKGEQISEPATVSADDGSFLLTYNTTDRAVPVGEGRELEVRYTGSGDMAGSSATVTVDIDKAKLTPMVTGSASKTYDGTTTVPDAGESNTLTIAFREDELKGSDDPTASASFAYADKNAGTGKDVVASNIVLDEGSSAWYELSADTATDAGLGSIAKASLTVSAAGGSITYGEDPAPVLGVTYEGLVNGETEGALREAGELAGTPTVTCAYRQGDPVGAGTFDITVDVSAMTATNYDISAAQGMLTVVKRTVQIDWSEPPEGGYAVGDGVDVEATVANVYGDDDVVLVLEGHDADAAGSYTARVIGLAGDDSDNYCLPEDEAALERPYTIAKSETEFPKEDGIVVRNGDGEETRQFTYGEQIVVTATPAATGVPAANALGSADASARSGGDDAGTQSPASLYYRPADGTAGGSDDVLLATDDAPDADGSYEMSFDTREKILPIGTVTLVVKYAGSEDLAPTEKAFDVTLAARPVTASIAGAGGGAITKGYDGTATAPEGTAITLDGILPGDEVAASAQAIAYNSVHVDEADYVKATGIELAGAAAPFYTANDTATAEASITPAPVQVIAGVAQVPYGVGALPQVAVTYEGFVGSETLEGLVASGALSGQDTVTTFCDWLDAASPAGIAGEIDVDVSGLSARDYSFEPVYGLLTVIPAVPAVDDADAAKQELPAGSKVSNLTAPVFAGVDGSPLDGMLTWYRDAAHEDELTSGEALSTGSLTLYWVFEPADVNYEAVSGGAEVTVAKAGDAQEPPSQGDDTTDDEPGDATDDKPKPGAPAPGTLTGTGDAMPVVVAVIVGMAGVCLILGAALRRR